jgi:hypothetical protein
MKVDAVLEKQRFLIYYCATLVRELDPALRRSTIVERLSAEEQKHPANA